MFRYSLIKGVSRKVELCCLKRSTSTSSTFFSASKPQTIEVPVDSIAKEKKEFNDRGDWKGILEKIVPAIVALKLSAPKSFDTESPSNSWATGFVVDAKNGIILTNRHVVSPGPMVAEAIFHNHEEVPVYPIYRDPVHDFGFFRYDPKNVRFTSVPQLELKPGKACVGVDIRVVGNDAAEKLSIATGTLARLDREVPIYGKDKYNDFNTFYFQASSGTTGGSSGSPVINSDGEVIALNAGGKLGTNASFYLPLDRVKRALQLLQENKPVSRGTIQTIFSHKPYDEVRRLGVTAETEAITRQKKPSETGMLVVSEVVPGGPAFEHLQPGDVLLRVDGKLTTDFVPLESTLDDSVGKEIDIEVERGGQPYKFSLKVQDLHSITPSSFLEFGGAIINPLSYMQARNKAIPVGSAYIADPGYLFQRSQIGKGSIITEIGNEKVPDVKTLGECLAKCKNGQRVVVRYNDPQGDEKVGVVNIDRKWFPFQLCERDDQVGSWNCEKIPNPPEVTSTEETTKVIGSTTALSHKNFVEGEIAPTLVSVDFDRPFSVNGKSSASFTGTGLILDAHRGLVVVDRNTVTSRLGDVTLKFANTLIIPAEIVYVHPVHNFSIVKYDPKLIGETHVQSCKVVKNRIKPSDKVWLVGLNSSLNRYTFTELVSRETIVAGVKWVNMPTPSPPRFQEHNLEIVRLQDAVSTEGGVICYSDGSVAAFWGSFACQQNAGNRRVEAQFMGGIPIDVILDVLPSLQRDEKPLVWSLGVELEPISLARGRELGIDQHMAEILECHDSAHRTIMSVSRRWGGTDAFKSLKNGDIVVAIDKKVVTTFREVELAVQKPTVEVKIIRNGNTHTLSIKTVELDGTDIDRLIFWQGLHLQTPPLAASSQRGIAHSGVYVACQRMGSPGARYGPPPTSRIIEVDGTPIDNLDEFLTAVKKKGSEQAVRVKYMDLCGKVYMTTLKLESTYWPTSELVLVNGLWERKDVI